MKKEPRGIQLKEETSFPITRLPVTKLIADQSAQARAGGLDQDYVDELVVQILDGARLPPIIAFHHKPTAKESLLLWPDGQTYVADGFHRLAAARRAEKQEIEVDLREGTRKDAIVYALGANSDHGKRRCKRDLEHAYSIGVTEEIFREWDVEAVAQFLKCSQRWARQITKEARDAAKASRDVEILKLAAFGTSQSDIAAKLGVDQSTVSRVVDYAKRQSAEMHNGETEEKEEQAVGNTSQQPTKQKVTTTTTETEQTPSSPQDPPENQQKSCDKTDLALESAKRAYLILTRTDAKRFRTWIEEHWHHLEQDHKPDLRIVGRLSDKRRKQG